MDTALVYNNLGACYDMLDRWGGDVVRGVKGDSMRRVRGGAGCATLDRRTNGGF